MTIEEAIDWICRTRSRAQTNMKDAEYDKAFEAVDMAILALKEHSDYKTAWDNLKEEVKENRFWSLTEIEQYMNATEEEITNCYIARRLKETESGEQKPDGYIEAMWEKERRLEQYAKEIKAYCENVPCGDCKNCYFGKQSQDGFASWCCKFYTDAPEDWEVGE